MYLAFANYKKRSPKGTFFELIDKWYRECLSIERCPHGDSNSSFNLERVASWASRRWGQLHIYAPTTYLIGVIYGGRLPARENADLRKCFAKVAYIKAGGLYHSLARWSSKSSSFQVSRAD